MDRESQRADLVRFLRTIQRPERPIEEVSDEESLVEAGLIDSLAVMEIVAYLESTYGIDFADGGLDPTELRSLSGILGLIEKHAA